MIALMLLCMLLVLWGLRRTLARTTWSEPAQRTVFTNTTLAIVGWLVLLTVLSMAGFFRDFTTLPPRPALVIIIPAVVLAILSFRKKCITLLQAAPPHWLVAMQGFRIVVEIQLWLAFTRGLLPVQMTFEGHNYDIVSGILGLLAGWLMWRFKPYWKTIAVVYNIIGLALLLNILVIAVLSMPGPTRYFMNDPANTIVGEFPFIFLPDGLVVLAIALHVFSLRQVFLNRGGLSEP